MMYRKMTALGLIVLTGIGGVATSFAQEVPPRSTADFPDVPTNHWAYQAVQDLAKRGYVHGDPNNRFQGQRPMTRYEFATVLARILQTVEELHSQRVTPANPAPQTLPTPPQTPSGASVTMEDLNKIQALADTFQKQLEAIGTPLARVQQQLDAMRQELSATKALAQNALEKANKAVDTSYGFGGDRKLQITGYVQSRYQSARSGNRLMFPEGLGAVTGATGSFNGNYAIGGTQQTFLVRRARFKMGGGLTANTSYGIQIDAGGWTTNNTSPNNVTVREANVNYTFGDGNPDRNLRLSAGLFPNFFGYELPLSSSEILAPERPLAFNEGGSGLFINQDYDRGINLSYNLVHTSNPGVRFAVALINGTGLNGLTGGGVVNGSEVGGGGNDQNNYISQIYRIAYHARGNAFGAGVSYYNGRIPRPGLVPGSNPPVEFVGANYQSGAKQVYGADVHYTSPRGLFILSEYVAGKYELRSYFNSDSVFRGDRYAPGNKIEGYYVQGGWNFLQKTPHPLSLGLSYDVFKRSKSGIGNNAVDGAGASGSSFDDENFGYGTLLGLDRQTRLRVWYERPNKVAHAATVAEPPRVGLFTAELQVKF